MLRLPLIAVALWAGSATAVAGYVNPTPGDALVYQIPGMHRAQVIRDRVYSRPGSGALRLDVYRPRTAPRSRRLPAVLIGGPPAFGAGKDSGQKIGWAQAVAASGMAAVAFDIRSDRFLATPRPPSLDVAAAIRYVKLHARELGLDANRLCTLGFSLGTAPWHLWAAMNGPDPAVRCNVVYYGPLDFHGFDDVRMPGRYVDEFSPITYLRRDGARIAPMLVAKAGRDRFTGINTSIDRFAAEAERAGADVTVLTNATGGHGFDVTDPTARSRTIIKQTLAFFRARLGVEGL